MRLSAPFSNSLPRTVHAQRSRSSSSRALLAIGASPYTHHHRNLTQLFVRLERRLYAKVLIENQNEHEMFERCMDARDDDGFIASAVQQLSTGPNSDLLNICNNITHLTISELDLENYESYNLSSLGHLQKLKYLSLHLLNGDIGTLSPNITHLQFRDVVWLNVVVLLESARDYPLLSHILLDCALDEVDEFAESLPDIMDALQKCQHVAFTVPRIGHPNVSETMLAEMKRRSQEQYYPQLIPVDIGGLDDYCQDIMQCTESLLSQFEFWDELEKFIARKRT